jgi:hypothetical protein
MHCATCFFEDAEVGGTVTEEELGEVVAAKK